MTSEACSKAARSARNAAQSATPDGRYMVVRGRLWRLSNPNIGAAERDALVKQLMDARRAIGAAKRAGDFGAVTSARAKVDQAKHALGERGPVWWSDGAPDYNRRLVRNTPYADWFAQTAQGREDR